MFLCVRKIKRKCTEATVRQKFVVFGITVICLWILGLFDKVQEKSFDEFHWPTVDNEADSTKFTKFPTCKFSKDRVQKLMIIVKSAAKNELMRSSVRKTWGHQNRIGNVEVMTVFVVGRSENSETRRKVDKESEKFNDILAISAIDSYRNNTFKLFAAIDYGANPVDCSPPDFVFLVDDDYIVHLPNLVRFAETKRKSDQTYEGFVFDTSPFRMKIHKHHISLEEYPFSRYPPYVSAGAVFLSSETAKSFQKSMRKLKIFPFDDVFTGILAKTLGIRATHNENFVFWSRHVSKEEWDQGVIAVHGYARKDLENEYTNIFG